MNTKTFSIVHVSGLALNDTHALINSTVMAALLQPPTALGELVNAALANMQSACILLGNQLNKSTKSPLTQKIKHMDVDRMVRWREIKNNINTHKKGRNTEIKEAATVFFIFAQPYWILDKMALNTKTDQINDILTKYNANSELVALAVLIGIDGMLTELGTANAAFETIYLQRNTKKSTNTAPSASSLKSAAVKNYIQFCTVVEQAVNLTPNEELTQLFNATEELRKTYSPLASKTTIKTLPKNNTIKTTDKTADTTTISAN